MTSPVVVDQVAVEILADARKLAKDMRSKIEQGLRDIDPDKALRDKIRNSKPIRIPVGLDPLLAAFQQDIRRQVTALARTANANIPVGANTDGLRAQIGAELAAIQRTLKAEIPTEPAGQAAFAAKLRAAVDAATAAVTANVRVDVDDRSVQRFSGALSRVGGMLPNLGGISSAFGTLGDSISRAAANSAQLGGSLSGSLSTAAGPAGALIGLLTSAGAAMAAIGTAAVLVVPAVTAVAGAAAAIPGALAGAAAAFGALKLGFGGVGDAISEALNPKAGGGGGGGGGAAKNTAAGLRQVEAAKRGVAAANRGLEASERSLASAERGVLAAKERLVEALRREVASQKAVVRARDDARESIEDLNRSLRGAMLSEEDAALGVEEALRALEAARLTGNIPDIKRADLAYRQALQTLDEAKDTTGDLSKETEEANRKGVEGSDQVQRALEDQQDAVRGVRDAQVGIIDAQDSLKSAQDGVAAAMDGAKSAADALKSAQESLAQSSGGAAGGAAGIASAYSKLAPSAKKFVDAIKGLAPAFNDLKLDVQERLFKGLDTTVTNLGAEWIPRLRKNLGEYATVFNDFFQDLGTSLTDQEFMADISTALDGFRSGLDALLDSVSQRLVPALGDLAEASAPFLEALGKGLARVVDRFSAWVQAGEKSGALEDFFDKATTALEEIGRIGGSVVRIIGNIIEIITGSQETDPNSSPLESFRRGLDKVADWLDDPQNQAQIQKWIDDIGRLATEFGNTATEINRFLGNLGVGGSQQSSTAGEDIGRALVSGIIAGLWGAYKESMEIFLNRIFLGGVIGYVKDLFGVKSPSTVFAAIGKDLIRGLLNGIGGMFESLRTKATEIKTNVMNRLTNAGQWLYQTGRNVVTGLGNGISSLGSWLKEKAGALKTRVTGALTNAANWLVSTGKDVIRGLWNGISSLGSWLWNKVSSFASTYVTKAINSALGVSSPSKVAAWIGRQVPAGLALGIDAETGQVEAAAQRLAAAALPQMQDAHLGLGLDADAAITRSLDVSDRRMLELKWANGATVDPVLREISKLIAISHGGSVDSAFATR